MNTYNKTDVAAPFGGFKQSGFGKDLGKLSSVELNLIAMEVLGFSISSSTYKNDSDVTMVIPKVGRQLLYKA